MPDDSSSDAKGFSRRRFLQVAGGSAAGSALLGVPVVVRGQEPAASARPGIKRFAASGQTISLSVNGKSQQVAITPDTTLLEVLRERLNLTGAKEVCDRGACGACTVLVDDRSVNSCMMLAIDAIDKPITTVEGLMNGERLDAIQQAYVDHDASQCGYCIPGFVVRSKALLGEMNNPNREQIKDGLCGNICRCATYVRILDAVEAAAKEVRS